MYIKAHPIVSLYVQKGRVKTGSDCVSHIKDTTGEKPQNVTGTNISHLGYANNTLY